MGHVAVAQAAVFGADHETRGPIISAHAVLRDEVAPAEDLRKKITEYARSNRPKHE